MRGKNHVRRMRSPPSTLRGGETVGSEHGVGRQRRPRPVVMTKRPRATAAAGVDAVLAAGRAVRWYFGGVTQKTAVAYNGDAL